EPPPEFDDLKSSPDHPKNLTTGNNRELNHDTEKPPPTIVLESLTKLKPPNTKNKNVTPLKHSRVKDVMRSRKPDAHHRQGRESTGGRSWTTIEGADATPESKPEHHRRE
ncbi:hypothetical protein IGI04_022606, partial [Brassica rapa subsp. trilocularis]